MDPLGDLNNIGKAYVGQANFEGMQQTFMDPFTAMSQEYYASTGNQLKVNDAFRTHEAQAEGYKRKPGLVAPPGHSLHERGMAMDIDETQAGELAKLGLLDKYGFTRPMMTKAPGKKYEPWHIQQMDFETRADKVAATIKNDPMAQLNAIGKPSQGDDPMAELSAIGGTPAPQTPMPPPAGIEQIPPGTAVQGQPGAQPTDPTSDTLAQFAGPAGEMVGQAMDLPFVPLRKGLEYLHKEVIEPKRERSIQEWADAMKPGGALEGAGAAAPEAFAALPSKETFVPTMEMALSVPYLKMISGGIGLLNEVGPAAFRKYAPDIFFKYTAKGGLPVPLTPTQVEEKLMAMTGTERAAMVKKYPQFREVMQEMTAAAENKAMAPEAPAAEVPPKPAVAPPVEPKPELEATPASVPQPPPQTPLTPPTAPKPEARFAAPVEEVGGRGELNTPQEFLKTITRNKFNDMPVFLQEIYAQKYGVPKVERIRDAATQKRMDAQSGKSLQYEGDRAPDKFYPRSLDLYEEIKKVAGKLSKRPGDIASEVSREHEEVLSEKSKIPPYTSQNIVPEKGVSWKDYKVNYPTPAPEKGRKSWEGIPAPREAKIRTYGTVEVKGQIAYKVGIGDTKSEQAARKAGYREVGNGSSYRYWTRGEPKKFRNLSDAMPLATEFSVEPAEGGMRWRLYNNRGEIFSSIRETPNVEAARAEMIRKGKKEREIIGTSPQPSALPEGVKDFMGKYGTARGVGKPEGLITPQVPVKKGVYFQRAIERNDLATLLHNLGGVDPKTYKDFISTSEERQILGRTIGKSGGLPADVMFHEAQAHFPDQFGHFEDAGDMVRYFLDGRHKRALNQGSLEKQIEDYHADTEDEARRKGVSPEGLAELEADVAREIAAEREAIRSEGSAGEVDTSWDLAAPATKPSQLNARLDALKADYPDIDREKAATVIRALPNAEPGQIANMVADPEMFSQVARGNLSASARAQLLKKATDAGTQKKMYGGGPDTTEFVKAAVDNAKVKTKETFGALKKVEDAVGEMLVTRGWLSRHPQAQRAASLKIKMFGERAYQARLAEAALQDGKERFAPFEYGKNPQGYAELSAAIQSGQRITPEQQFYVDTYRKMLDDLWGNAKEKGIRIPEQLDNYMRDSWINHGDIDVQENVKNYFEGKPWVNHFIKDSKGNPKREAPVRWSGKRTLTGTRAYFKHKSLDPFTAVMLGYEPRIGNMVEMMQWDLAQKNHYVAGMEWLKAMKDEGLRGMFPIGKQPPGWKPIDDPTGNIARAFLKEETETRAFKDVPGEYDMTTAPEVKAQAYQTRMYAPPDVAKIVNNFLAEGLKGNYLYQKFRAMGDPLRKYFVGFSPYHIKVTINNDLATGIGQDGTKAIGALLGGRPGDAVKYSGRLGKNVALWGTAERLKMGRAFVHEALKPGTHPEMAPYVKDFVAAGGRIPSAESLKPVWQVVGKSLKDAAEMVKTAHPFKAIDRAADATSKPIMEYVVPWAKIAHFVTMRERALPEFEKMADEKGLTGADRENAWLQRQQEIVRLGDNMFGQLAYDNLHFSNSVKDALFFILQYPGWNIGSGSWMTANAGAAWQGAKKLAGKGTIGQYEKDSVRYSAGLLAKTAIFNATLYYLLHGNMPDDKKELVTKGVWTGGHNPDGSKQYMRDADYMRDLIAVSIGSMEALKGDTTMLRSTVRSKMPFLVATGWELLNNEDYFNTRIWGPEGQGLAKYAKKKALPYSFANIIQADTPVGKYGWLGGYSITPASVTRTPLEAEMAKAKAKHAPRYTSGTEAATFDKRREAEKLAREGNKEEFEAKVKEMKSAGQLNRQQEKNLRTKMQDVRKYRFKTLGIDDAVAAYQAGDKEERAFYKPILQKKIVNLFHQKDKAKYYQYRDVIKQIDSEKESPGIFDFLKKTRPRGEARP